MLWMIGSAAKPTFKHVPKVDQPFSLLLSQLWPKMWNDVIIKEHVHFACKQLSALFTYVYAIFLNRSATYDLEELF